jgi:DNA-binding transcriptional LysR family regulator
MGGCLSVATGYGAPMELRHLRYFIAVAEEQNVTRAAARLHLSQPPLSRQVRDLEAELGVELFHRAGKSVRLTEAGRFFLTKARGIVCDAETAAQQLREQFGAAARTIRLGFIAPVLDDLVVPSVREFRQRHPKTKVSLFDLPPRAQLDRLRQHELDAAILGNLSAEDRAQFKAQALWRGRMTLVLPDSHRFAGRKSLKLSLLGEDDWVSLSDTFFPGRRAFLQDICRRAGFEPRIRAELDSLPLMLAAVAAGEGVALMPAHAGKLPHAGCVIVPIAGSVPMTELLLITPRQPAGREVGTFLSLIASRAADMQSSV